MKPEKMVDNLLDGNFDKVSVAESMVELRLNKNLTEEEKKGIVQRVKDYLKKKREQAKGKKRKNPFSIGHGIDSIRKHKKDLDDIMKQS